jgi:enoyl-CoA hydratase/carnithine racemase
VDALERWPGVTVAHLHGFALGAGLELALGCDVVAGQGAVQVGLPGLVLGLLPGFGSLDRLRLRLGAERCRRLFLHGDMLTGPQAVEWGLLDRMVADEGEVVALAHQLGEFGPGAVAAIRSLRLVQRSPAATDDLAMLFAAPFASGECQRRLRKLMQ